MAASAKPTAREVAAGKYGLEGGGYHPVTRPFGPDGKRECPGCGERREPEDFEVYTNNGETWYLRSLCRHCSPSSKKRENMARGITEEANLPPYAQADHLRIKSYGFSWAYFAERRLAEASHRVQVRDIKQLAPPQRVNMYAIALKRGDQFPPVIVTADGYLVDGHTRTEAARKIGWTTFPTFVVDVNYSDAPASVRKQLQKLGAGFNNTHGQAMTGKDIARIISDVGEQDTSPKELARELHISESTANTHLNAARTRKRAEKVGVKLDETLTPSHLRLFGNKTKYFSDDVFREFITLTQDAHLTIAATTDLAKRLEVTGTEHEKMELLAVERSGYHNVIDGGSVSPSKAAKLRQSLGFLLRQEDPDTLAEQDPHASRMHIRTVRDAWERLDKILLAQEQVERARLTEMG